MPLIFLIVIQFNTALAFDVAKEKRIAEQTIDSLFDGEPVWLNTKDTQENLDGTRFLALFTQGDSDKATIILIHGTGQGPDTPFVIAPLRELFGELSYTTLSLQMPVLDDDKTPEDYVTEFDEASSRLSSAVTYSRDNGAQRIHVVAHSLGSTMLMNWATNSRSEGVDALVTLGFGGIVDFDARASIAKVTVPLLDVIGEQDFDAIVASAPDRSALVTATNRQSAQLVVADADHFYNGKERQLVALIDGWLTSLEN